MPFLIPLVIGAGTTGYWWYQSNQKQQEQPSFKQEFLNVLYPVLILLLILLFFRWLYRQGSA